MVQLNKQKKFHLYYRGMGMLLRKCFKNKNKYLVTIVMNRKKRKLKNQTMYFR